MAKIICLSCFNELSRYDKIFSCSRKHNFCAPCGKSMHLQCEVCLRIIFLCSLIFLLGIPKTKFDYGRACIESIKAEVKSSLCSLLKIEKNKEISRYVWTLENYFVWKNAISFTFHIFLISSKDPFSSFFYLF